MKISKTYRTIAVTLALLMFATSIGFAVDMHYCGDRLQSVSFFGKAKTCLEMSGAKVKTTCRRGHHQENGTAIQKRPCCNDRSVHFLPDQDQEVRGVSFKLSQPLQQFVTALVFAFFRPVGAEISLPVNERYRPPLIHRDIPVLIQSFLL